ncbi:MAG TPA: cyclic peptide export ABC transporter [Thermoanaerobaculia bacterium]|nr:cyclic peptide export ABC transporter [Thermoanaerobaculia bacterium]
MKLIELLRRESDVSLRKLIILAAVSGLSTALVLAVINAGAASAAHHEQSKMLMLAFLAVIATYFFSLRTFMSMATREVETILDRLRTRLGDKVRRCDLGPIEYLGKTVIYAGITKETASISQAALAVIVGLQAGILIAFTGIYVAVLSPLAFVLTAITTFIIAKIFLRRAEAVNREQHESLTRENQMFELLTNMLEGFKEVRLNRARSDDLFAHFVEISNSSMRLRTRTMAQVSTTFILSQVAFYVLMGVIVFIVPRFSLTYTDEIVKIATAVLFLTGPLSGLISIVPAMAASNASVENIDRLDAALDRSLSARDKRNVAVPPLTKFREISLERVVFRYEDAAGASFGVGPIDFTIRAGETVFIAGGNGSGKSTFLKLFTMLYFPQHGVVKLDGEVVGPALHEAYQSLFSTVFTDFHLFDRLYGLLDVPDEEVNRRLESIEMTGKTRVVDSAFETLELSTGQRKRLALLISILEDRAIYIFDEMAADQDPAFRRKFYKEILPLLKQHGKTVLAVTHDDKYFGDADRLLKMDEGRLVPYTHPAAVSN